MAVFNVHLYTARTRKAREHEGGVREKRFIIKSTRLSPFHTGYQVDTTVEERPDNCSDLIGFHTRSSSDTWSYDINFGRILLNHDPAGRTTNFVVRPHVVKRALYIARTRIWTKFSSRGKPGSLPSEQNFKQRTSQFLCSTIQRFQFRLHHHVYYSTSQHWYTNRKILVIQCSYVMYNICELRNLWTTIFLLFSDVLSNAINFSHCIKFKINFNRPEHSFSQLLYSSWQ